MAKENDNERDFNLLAINLSEESLEELKDALVAWDRLSPETQQKLISSHCNGQFYTIDDEKFFDNQDSPERLPGMPEPLE